MFETSAVEVQEGVVGMCVSYVYSSAELRNTSVDDIVLGYDIKWGC